MQYCDLKSYLNGDILTKVDRASMSNSLEVRVPLIDHRIVEASWRLPKNFKINNGITKFILKEILKKYIPKNYFDRPKMGFGIPLDHWLRNQLFSWSKTILEETDWENKFQLDKSFILNSWKNFNSYGSPSATHIWILISLGAWAKNFRL